MTTIEPSVLTTVSGGTLEGCVAALNGSYDAARDALIAEFRAKQHRGWNRSRNAEFGAAVDKFAAANRASKAACG